VNENALRLKDYRSSQETTAKSLQLLQSTATEKVWGCEHTHASQRVHQVANAMQTLMRQVLTLQDNGLQRAMQDLRTDLVSSRVFGQVRAAVYMVSFANDTCAPQTLSRRARDA
jgi:hypothetical protein